MKIRTGFVSNSSSSSFIVAVSKQNRPKELVVRIPFRNIGEKVSAKKLIEDAREYNDDALEHDVMKLEDTHVFLEIVVDQVEDMILYEALLQDQDGLTVLQGG